MGIAIGREPDAGIPAVAAVMALNPVTLQPLPISRRDRPTRIAVAGASKSTAVIGEVNLVSRTGGSAQNVAFVGSVVGIAGIRVAGLAGMRRSLNIIALDPLAVGRSHMPARILELTIVIRKIDETGYRVLPTASDNEALRTSISPPASLRSIHKRAAGKVAVSPKPITLEAIVTEARINKPAGDSFAVADKIGAAGVLVPTILLSYDREVGLRLLGSRAYCIASRGVKHARGIGIIVGVLNLGGRNALVGIIARSLGGRVVQSTFNNRCVLIVRGSVLRLSSHGVRSIDSLCTPARNRVQRAASSSRERTLSLNGNRRSALLQLLGKRKLRNTGNDSAGKSQTGNDCADFALNR